MKLGLDESALFGLINSYRNEGDENALEMVVAQLYPWGNNEVVKIASSNDCDWTEAQSRFAGMFVRAIRGFDPEKGDFRGFVSGVARNAVREAVKVRKKDREHVVYESEMSDESEGRPYHDVAGESQDEERSVADAQSRALFMIVALTDGFSHQKISFGLCTYVIPTWNASQIVEERYGPALLPTLLDTIVTELEDGELYVDYVDMYRTLISGPFERTGRDVFKGHYPQLDSVLIQDSQLKDYFGKGGGARSIADWRNRLKTKVECFVMDPEEGLRKARQSPTSEAAIAVLTALEEAGS